MTIAFAQPPACSIVLPTFNRAHLLAQAIDSVLAQSFGEWELIVVDDGSTDATSRLVARHRDRRIRYVSQLHRGRSAARNRGVELARSDLIGFLDSDDRLLPHALSAHQQVFLAQPEVGMTVAGYDRIDEIGRVVGVRTPWTEGGELSCRGWLLNCFGIPGTTMVRRAWLARVGFRPDYEPAEDWDLFLRLAVAGCPMSWVRESVCQYREHEGNSARALDARLAAVISMLADLAQDPRLRAEARSLMPRARAWAYANSARAAAEFGDDDHVRVTLGLAREIGGFPTWRRGRVSASPEGFESLLEPIVAQLDARSTGPAAGLSRALTRWGLSPRELRRAMARVEMRQFFSCLEDGPRAGAARHLRVALRHDPRWLANRAVAGFLLGQRRRPG